MNFVLRCILQRCIVLAQVPPRTSITADGMPLPSALIAELDVNLTSRQEASPILLLKPVNTLYRNLPV